MTIAPDDIPKALADLGSADHLSEVVVLSTCKLVEIYAYAEKFHGGYQDIREFFGRHADSPPKTSTTTSTHSTTPKRSAICSR